MAKARQARLHPAQHDALTGLAHRGLGHARLEAALETARGSGAAVAVVVLCLARFQALNAALGYAVGDRVLQEVARRLARSVARYDTVARVGSDEFLALLVRPSEGAALAAARSLAAGLAREVEVDGLRIPVRAHAGVALFPDHGDDGVTLLRRADLALQQAKRAQQPFALYVAGQDEEQTRRLAIVHALREAVSRRQLHLAYQPKLELRSRRVLQAEALLRWHHPAIGALPPDEFIPLAEQSGQIQPLTRWVLDDVLRQVRAWRETGLTLGIAVNVSALDLAGLDLPNALASLLEKHGVEPRRLTLEVTESALMRHPAEALEVLVRLKGLGVRLALDDFGVGFSSLSRLRQLPVDELKIDRSFVGGLRAGSTEAVLVRSIVELGHRLGLRVVAEGVEDAASLDLLTEFGCDVVQGYGVSPPLSPQDLAVFCRTPRAEADRAVAQPGRAPRTRGPSP